MMIIQTKLTYFLIGLIACYLFAQNFILGFDPGLIQLRELDDLAFQLSLKQEQINFLNLNWIEFFSFTDYGYGFIYWGPLAVVSIPFSFLNDTFGISYPLLVFPRQVSLAFLLVSLWYLRKIILRLGGTELQAAFAVLLASLLPTFGYFSGRFGTVAELAFWGMFSVHEAVKFAGNNKKYPFAAIIALAAGIGVKLSGAIFAPLVLLICVWKYRRKISFQLLQVCFVSFIVFSVALITFANPALLVSWLKPEIASSYFDEMSHFLAVPLTGLSPDFSLIGVIASLFGSIISFILFLSYLGGFLIGIQTKDVFRKFVFIVLIIVYSAISIFLFLKVSANGSAVVYFMPLSMLLPIGLLGYSEINKVAIYRAIAFCIIILSIVDISFRVSVQKDTNATSQDGFSPFSYLVSFDNSHDDIVAATSIAGFLNLQGNTGKDSIVLDYSTPLNGNALKYPSICFGYLYSNLSSYKDLCGGKPTYILLDKTSIGFSSDEEFEQFISHVSPLARTSLLADRELRLDLQNPENAKSMGYELATTIENIQIYKSIN